jgi:TolA-binding protein
MNAALRASLFALLVLTVPVRAQEADPFLSAPSRPHPAATPRPAAPAFQPGTPEAFLQQGNAALRRQDYAAAEAAAREVLKVRHSPHAADAHYLLAQSFAGRRDYSHAADAYDDAYDDAKTGPRAQDALFGKANALATIGKNRGACSALEDLKSKFPTPRPDLVAPINAVRQLAACR